MLAPVERFLAIEAASGIVLMLGAAVALIWANSSFNDTYAHLWHTPIGLRVGSFTFERDLHFWINEGLMTIFFFLVGLEIRREIHAGELSDIRRASLPVVAAVGGMIVPALIFASLNSGRSSAQGWAIPMATDIAFAVGALALLGKRVQPALRILLLALAVIDDVGAIVVIALFYSSTLAAAGFVILGVGLAAVLFLQLLGIRSPLAYVAPGIAVWAGAYSAGIHPTLAGVILGMMTPVKAWHGPRIFLDETQARVDSLRLEGVVEEHALLPHLDRLKSDSREAVAPVERLQHALHRWVAFGIMPLFALANAGVSIGHIQFDGDAAWVFLGVSLGLAAGKPAGILLLTWLAARTGIVRLPRGVRWTGIAIVGMVGGIGFTMALFIAQLAFPTGALLEIAKLGVLSGSLLAGVLALVIGYRALPPTVNAGAAKTEAEAEASSER
jgi:NhaA family Na+:H+ antiporter